MECEKFWQSYYTQKNFANVPILPRTGFGSFTPMTSLDSVIMRYNLGYKNLESTYILTFLPRDSLDQLCMILQTVRSLRF